MYKILLSTFLARNNFVGWLVIIAGQMEGQEILGIAYPGFPEAGKVRFNPVEDPVVVPNVTIEVAEVEGGFDLSGEGVQISLRRKSG